MRKTIIMLFMAVPLATFAQLKVKSNGKVCIGTQFPMESTYLSIGQFSNINDTIPRIGIYSRVNAPTNISSQKNISVNASATGETNTRSPVTVLVIILFF